MSEKNKTMNANTTNIYDDLVLENKPPSKINFADIYWKKYYEDKIPENKKPTNIYDDLVAEEDTIKVEPATGIGATLSHIVFPDSTLNLTGFPISTGTINADNIRFVGSGITYTFDEVKYINEALDHINSTYSQHYSHGKYQATDLIIDTGHGTGFNIGNIQKYAMRYGKKEGYNRKDLLKIIHYAIIQLYVHDKDNLSLKETK